MESRACGLDALAYLVGFTQFVISDVKAVDCRYVYCRVFRKKYQLVLSQEARYLHRVFWMHPGVGAEMQMG